MSGIYIPGIEIPDDCVHCPCADSEYMDCNLMPGSGIGYKKRPDNCPLIPVPEHGRLIDADALMLRVDIHGTNKYGMLDEDIRQFVNAAPTIIPAEEGE